MSFTWTPEQIWYASSVNEGYFVNEQHLLVGPNVITGLLSPEKLTQPVIKPRMAILHTNGGKNSATPQALYKWASRLDVVVEPHIDTGSDGTIMQMQYFNRRADCNGAANQFKFLNDPVLYGALSIESQDDGFKDLPSEVNFQPWTWLQIVSHIRVCTAWCIAYEIRCTAPTWKFDSGIGHHSLFREWSSSGHSCPGNARIRQMDAIRHAVTIRVAQYYEKTGGQCP